MKVQLTHYRYIREYPFFEDEGEKRIEIEEFETVKETPCGYWIKPKGSSPLYKQRFVLKVSRKKYAYTNKEDAFESFRIRTSKSLGYAKRDVKNAAEFMKLIADFEINSLQVT